jgi:hypothetical protein
MDLGGINLRYATAQPLCVVKGKVPLYVFFAPEGIDPEYVFDKTAVIDMKATDADVIRSADRYSISIGKPGTGCVIAVTLGNGKRIDVLTLSHQQALDAWKGMAFGVERLFISDQELTFPGKVLTIKSEGNPRIRFSVYPLIKELFVNKSQLKGAKDGIFSTYTVNLKANELKASFKEVHNITTYLNKGQLVALDNRDTTLKNVANPGPQYQTNLLAVAGSRYYELTLPSNIGDLREAYLKISYTGDTGALYLNGVLIADDYYSGLPMTLGLKKIIVSGLTKKLLLQIVPFTNEREVFFEDGIRERVKKYPALVSSVSVVPQYQVIISEK